MVDRARQFTSSDLRRREADFARASWPPDSRTSSTTRRRRWCGAPQLVGGLASRRTPRGAGRGGSRCARDRADRRDRTAPRLPRATGFFSPIERADREEAGGRLARGPRRRSGHGPEPQPRTAVRSRLDDLANAVPDEALDAALRSVAARCHDSVLAEDIERAATRIHDLVGAVKRFTYMDRATVREPANIAQGISPTRSPCSRPKPKRNPRRFASTFRPISRRSVRTAAS